MLQGRRLYSLRTALLSHSSTQSAIQPSSLQARPWSTTPYDVAHVDGALPLPAHAQISMMLWDTTDFAMHMASVII